MQIEEASNIYQVFANLNITQESITSCAQSVYAGLSDIHIIMKAYTKAFRTYLESRAYNQNVLAMFYVTNEVLYRLKIEVDHISTDCFTKNLEDLIPAFTIASITSKYVDLIIKVLLIWKTKEVMNRGTIDKLIELFKRKTEGTQHINANDVDFDYSHLIKYARKCTNRAEWADRLERLKQDLQVIEIAEEDNYDMNNKLNELDKCKEVIPIQDGELTKLKETANAGIHADLIRMVQDIRRIDTQIEDINRLINN